MANKQIGIVGEVLFDQFPDGRQSLGGAPFNVAWHLQAFGQHPGFISRIGNDTMGQSIRSAMLAWGMDTGFLQTDNGHPTGTVEVTISNGEPGYAILNNQAYDFIDANQLNPERQYSILYHGTLALRHQQTEQAVTALITRHTGKVFIDANLREPWWQIGQVEQWLARADWLKLNHDELMQLAPRQKTLQTTLQRFIEHFRLETLVVTCGDQGAIALTNTGEFTETAPAANLAIADTVGAGDAFAAVLLLGLQQGWPLPLTMHRAQDFASALVTKKGAIVQDLEFYQPFVAQWGLS
ncbi:MAG: carbohydrate kinase [Methylovulum sp.]|nr:carbohydrate kinase [Methylovulum sp.]